MDGPVLIYAASWMPARVCVNGTLRKWPRKTDSHHWRRPRRLVAVLLHHPDQLQQLNAGLWDQMTAVRVKVIG